MTVEYNVVIVGSDAVARYAAEYARSLNARVALVTTLPENASHLAAPKPDLYTNTLTLQALRHIGQALETYRHGPHQAGPLLLQPEVVEKAEGVGKAEGRRQKAEKFLPSPVPLGTKPTPTPQLSNLRPKSKIDWFTLRSLVQTLVEGQYAGRSLQSLEAMGVDVVYGGGTNGAGTIEFCDRPLGVQTSRRLLPAQAYVIAETGAPMIPAIPGIEQIQYDTLDTFFHPHHQPREGTPDPKSVLIFSSRQGLEQGIETAYCLATLGQSVIFVTDQAQFVSDADANAWVMEALTTAGVKVYLNTSMTQVVQTNDGYIAHLLRPGSDATDHPQTSTSSDVSECQTDRLILVTGRQVDFTTLKLSALGINFNAEGIKVNPRYQSSHARIFACGDAIGSPASLNHRYGEVAIAIHHALFSQKLWNQAWLSTLLLRGLRQWLNPALPNVPLRPNAPGAIAKILHISPPLATIGFTETEALERYGRGLTILRQPYQDLDQAQLLTAHCPDATTGECKLLVRDDGQIVGAIVWGVQSEEVMGAIALAMQQSIPLGELTQVCPPIPSITAELLQKLGMQWERHRLNKSPLLFDWLEMVFNWQRDWTKQ